MKLDPVITNYLSSDRKTNMVVFVKLESKNFKFSKFPQTTEKLNPKNMLFKKEVQFLFSTLENYTINSYLANVSTVEVILGKEELKNLTENQLIAAIYAVKEITYTP